MDIHLSIIGISLVILGLLHIIFPWYFNWETELSRLSLVNRQVMQVHTFFIALIVLLMGILCLLAPRQLLETELGHLISFGLAIFWTTRLVIQFFGFSPDLWKGKAFETTVHILFSGFWTYLSWAFWTIALSA
jgi:hypothetical protein